MVRRGEVVSKHGRQTSVEWAPPRLYTHHHPAPTFVFITKGPCCTMGSLMGCPAMSRNLRPACSASAAAAPAPAGAAAAGAVASIWSPSPSTRACWRGAGVPLMVPLPATQASIHHGACSWTVLCCSSVKQQPSSSGMLPAQTAPLMQQPLPALTCMCAPDVCHTLRHLPARACVLLWIKLPKKHTMVEPRCAYQGTEPVLACAHLHTRMQTRSSLQAQAAGRWRLGPGVRPAAGLGCACGWGPSRPCCRPP